MSQANQVVLCENRSMKPEISRENKVQQAEASSKIRAYMKIHKIKKHSNKLAARHLQSKDDSDCEELSQKSPGMITSTLILI